MTRAGRAGDEASVRAFLARSGADWRVARCPAALVERLRVHDHHVVTIDGRAGLLLAYHLWTLSTAEARVFVLFHYVAGHPRAPAIVQTAIDELTFEHD